MFDGSKVIDWCFKVKQYLMAIDDTASEADQIKFASNLLTGKALTWWHYQLQTQGNHYATIQHFTNDIYKHFVDADLVNKLRDQMDVLVQSKNQSV